MDAIIIQQTLVNQRTFFNTNKTKTLDFRKQQLLKLKTAIKKYEQEIVLALHSDLGKSYQEAFLTEISIVQAEIDYHLKNLKRWTKPQRVSTPIIVLPSSSKIMYEPLGVALIIAPWNYPFQLLFNPLVGAIASGCCSILKSSPEAPATSKIMKVIVNEIFDHNFVQLVEGGIEESNLLLQQKFDLIFFTGSPRVGKIVMKAAANNLTPVILELGGKSPCIVDSDADIKTAAKRIIWGKFINAGQTCIAPDYLFVHNSKKEQLFKEMKNAVESFFTSNPQSSAHYARIITNQAFDRLCKLLDNGNIIFGGKTDASLRYIAPTLLDNVSFDSAIMQEEIFGPILPTLTFENINDVINYVKVNEKPLALYYFGSQNEKKILNETSSGGVCINDTLMHIINHHLPFGGVGNSGIGKYHGKFSIEVFSNAKPIVKTPTFIDLPLKYAPYKFFKLIKKLI